MYLTVVVEPEEMRMRFEEPLDLGFSYARIVYQFLEFGYLIDSESTKPILKMREYGALREKQPRLRGLNVIVEDTRNAKSDATISSYREKVLEVFCCIALSP